MPGPRLFPDRPDRPDPPDLMLKVALTGGIATGKSHVLEQFRKRGVPCLDADVLAHGVESAGTESTQAIAARFGAGVLAADGAVDRTKLAPIVFTDPVARRDLEAIARCWTGGESRRHEWSRHSSRRCARALHRVFRRREWTARCPAGSC